MSKRALPNGLEILSVMRLLADTAAGKGDPFRQHRHFIKGMAQLTRCNWGFMAIGENWLPGHTPRMTSLALVSEDDPVILRYFAEFGAAYPLMADPFCALAIPDPAMVQSRSWTEVIPDIASARRYPEMMDLRSTSRVGDGLVTVYRDPKVRGRILGSSLHRYGERSKLRARDRALIEFAMREAHALAARGHLSLFSTPTNSGLPHRLRQVQSLLLRGQSPKTIARTLGLSIHTTREHVQRLYGHHGVNGRDEFMARFIDPDAADVQ